MTDYIVILPIYNGFEAVQRCLNSLCSDQVPLDPAIAELRIVDDASPDPRILPLLEQFSCRDSRIVVIQNQHNLGYLTSVNRQLEGLEGGVILLNSDTEVMRDWATRMVEGAARYPRLAALTPLSNNASFSTIGDPADRQRPLNRHDLPRIEALLASRRGASYPLAPTGNGFCLLLTPLARSIVCSFNPDFAPGYEEENDLCQTLRAHGLQCRIATDVYVHHEGGESFGTAKRQLQEKHTSLMLKRHPTYAALVNEWFTRIDAPHTLIQPHSTAVLRVLVDCEVLGQAMTGVQRYIHNVLRYLLKPGGFAQREITAVLRDQELLERCRKEHPQVEWITDSDLGRQGKRWDIAHICHANVSLERLALLRRSASRVVVTLHDLIAYENPSYFESGDAFLHYRRNTRILTAFADLTLAISPATLGDAREQLALPPDRIRLFPNPLFTSEGDPLFVAPGFASPDGNMAPAQIAERGPLPEAPFCLVVGTDFRHKHLLETVRLFRDAVVPSHPDMMLRLVGPAVATGGSLADVRALLAQDPALAEKVVIEGAIHDQRLSALYQAAALVLYLSLQEGFGLIPYEAASFGSPTLVADTSVYRDLPRDVVMRPFHCPESLELIQRTLSDPGQRQRNVTIWQERLANDRRRTPQQELESIYRDLLAQPRSPLAELVDDLMHPPGSPSPALTVSNGPRTRLRRLLRRLPEPVKQRLRQLRRVMPGSVAT